MSLKNITINTAAISSVGLIRLLAQFIAIPILSRLLSPDQYGIVALAMPFVLFTMIFVDAGIGQSLVRSKHNDERAWSTCFWLTLMLGVSFAIFIAICAPIAAYFFEEPRLLLIILALTPIVFIQASNTIFEVSLRKRYRFGALATIEIIAIAISISTAVAVALMGGGAWALVAQQLALYATKLFMTFLASSYRPKIMFNLPAITEHLNFGKSVIGINLINFSNLASNSFVIGKILGATLLGFHTMTFLFAALPVKLISGPLQYVLYAHLSPRSEDEELIRKVFLFLTRGLTLLVFPAIGLIAAVHTPFFTLLLSEKWAKVGELFLIAAPAAALQTLIGLHGCFMLIIGQPNVQFRAATESLLASIALLFCTVWFGLEWVVVGYTLSVLLYFPRNLYLVLPRLQCTIGAYLKVFLIPLAITVIGISTYLMAEKFIYTNDLGSVGLALLIGIFTLALGIFLQYRTLITDIHYFKEEL